MRVADGVVLPVVHGEGRGEQLVERGEADHPAMVGDSGWSARGARLVSGMGVSVRLRGGGMQFRMLGPLTVENDRGPVALGGPKPRALLAALLVEAGPRRVRRPPGGRALGRVAAARRGVRVARLRLPAAGRARGGRNGCASRPPATSSRSTAPRSTPPPSSSTSPRRGDAAAADDHAAALQRLDAGLALWRGDALAEFADLEFAAAEAGRLNELRAGAVEDRARSAGAPRPARGRHPRAGGARAPPPHPGTHDRGAHARPVRQRPGRRRARGLPRPAPATSPTSSASIPARTPSRPTCRCWRTTPPSPPGARPGTCRGAATELVGRDDDVAGRPGGAAGRAAGDPHRGRRGRQVQPRDRDRPPRTRPLPRRRLAVRARVRSPTAARSGTPSPRRCGVQQRPLLTIEQTLIEYLRGRSLLLVLDNCEHVLDRAAAAGGRDRAALPGRGGARHQPGTPGGRGRARVVGAAAADRGRVAAVRRAGHRGPTRTSASTRRPRRPSPRSARSSTGCRWASSSPPPGCGP